MEIDQNANPTLREQEVSNIKTANDVRTDMMIEMNFCMILLKPSTFL